MKASVIKPDPGSEYFFAEGCFITELSNSIDDAQLSIARARLEPGKTTRWHRLVATAERYLILAGSGLVEIGELPATPVVAGDVVLIPPLARQRITNTGTEALVFLAICTPRFSSDDYEDVDDKPAHL